MALKKNLISFRRQDGQGMVEYALLLVMIAIVVIGILAIIGTQLEQVFARVAIQLKFQGNFSGEEVTATVNSVSASPGSCFGGSCANITGSASFTVNKVSDGSPVSASAVVLFAIGSSSLEKGGVGSASFSGLSGPNSGTVRACVVSVEGYSLTGQACSSNNY